MQLVLLSADLMIASAAEGPARRAGVPVRVVGQGDAAVAACRGAEGALLAVDLTTPGLDVAALLAALRGDANTANVHVLAFGPHVQEAKLTAASAAGCDEVVARGEFERRLGAALQRIRGGTPSSS
jgi:CheY-like chemotaxis protein